MEDAVLSMRQTLLIKHADQPTLLGTVKLRPMKAIVETAMTAVMAQYTSLKQVRRS
jgi:hypothetical protein